jgi:peptide methionine sulfoxide reductase MsrB
VFFVKRVSQIFRDVRERQLKHTNINPNKGTEPAGTGEYNKHYEKGKCVYVIEKKVELTNLIY